jgi:hypothetical protein
MDVAWIKNDFECDVLWGIVNIETNKVPLTIIEDCGSKKKVQAIHIGTVFDFPMSAAMVFYCYDDDMIYIHPFEAYLTYKRGPYHPVHPLRSFSSIVDDFR